MYKKMFLPAALALTVLLTLTIFTTKKQKPEETSGPVPALSSIASRGELRVAMDARIPGFFILGGESYGYQYDLLKAYAESLDVELNIISGKSSATCAQMISDGQVDMVTTLTENLFAEDEAYSVPLYNTSYVLLGGKQMAREAAAAENFSLTRFLDGSRLLVSTAFENTKAYKGLLDSLGSTSQIYVSPLSSIALTEQLASGDFDFVICESGEAHIASALVKNVAQIYEFSEQIPLSAVVSPANIEDKAHFAAWLEGYRSSPQYAMLNYLYFEKGIVGQFTGKGLTAKNASGISAYDKLFKKICDEEGYDWRLISAIAYNESRFNPDVVSTSGARGLMQVMPRTARQFDVDGDIMEPENNILLGIKILGKIEKSLKFDPSTPRDERLKFVLACYNAGIGHVMDARSLARKYGADADSWDAVSDYLRMKSNPAIVQDPAVKHGRFNSGETLAFVRNVIDRYETYCDNISL